MDEAFDKYKIVTQGNGSSIRIGKYTELVFEKHSTSFSEQAATKTRSNVVKVFNELKEQMSRGINSNTLFVGKVQSGKTSNLECLMALAFDNGFNLMVIYGGYDTELLSQTTQRFRNTFDITGDYSLDDRTAPVLFSSDDNDTMPLKTLNPVFNRIVSKGVPIIVSVMKNKPRLTLLNKVLSNVDTSCVKALVIDDEGDQASLNNARYKESDASATYAAIRNMKTLLGDPLYCSVTATPQANIFLDELSALRPGSVHLLYPGAGYCGADEYHLQNENDFLAIPVEDDISSYVQSGQMPESLKDAVLHFILSSAIMAFRDINDSDMIVHMDKAVDAHNIIYGWIEQYIDNLKYAIQDCSDAVQRDYVNTIYSNTYNRYFSSVVRSEYPLDSSRMIEEVIEVLNDIYCVLQNGTDKTTRSTGGWFAHRIYIGADLLQRGLTFNHLVTTYFTRWAKSGGNMDTNLQRARWFGYRSKYFDLCRMFTTDEIASEFVNLAYMEDDLWRQFEAVQAGDLDISKIVVLAENTRQKPTRSSVANYTKLTVSEWLRQENGTFDKFQTARNNKAVDEIRGMLDFDERSLARRDGDPNCLVAIADQQLVAGLFEKLDGIFSDSFARTEILTSISNAKNIAIVLMSKGQIRRRSFYKTDRNKIKVLQQGRGSKEMSETQYLGDAAAYVPETDLTIQIHNIVPTHADDDSGQQVPEPEHQQYMYAIYSPDRAMSGFVKA